METAGSQRLLARITVALGAVFTALGIWAALGPRSFATVLADFGPFNAHLVHDFAAASAAVGIGLVVAGRVPRWRAPVLALAAAWNGLHALSHVIDVIDVGDAASPVVGWVEVALLLAVTVLLAFLATAAAKAVPAEQKGES